MSRSYRSQPEGQIAKRRARRDENGDIILPRIVRRNPAPGDVHPVGAAAIRRKLRQFPEKYVYGLKRIELRARTGKIGHPFGCYFTDEKIIVLYSLPLQWHLGSACSGLIRELESYDAKIEKNKESVRVTWPDDIDMSAWFFWEVFTHELGHHYVEQYRHKNSRVQGDVHNEIMADLLSFKILKEDFRLYHCKREVDNK